jgi:hypothetical protein
MPNIAFAFFLGGLDIVYALRTVIPFDKLMFTYIVQIFGLILLLNYKNILKRKFYNWAPMSIITMLFLIIVISFVNSYIIKGLDKQTFSLLILLLFFLSLFTTTKEDFSKIHYYLFYISTISTVLAWLLTPTSAEYWLTHGGRFYVSNTKNNYLPAATAIINIVTGIFILKENKKKYLWKFMFICIVILDIYIYIISQSKSTVLGILIIIIYLWINYNLSLKNYILITLLIVLAIFSMFYFLPDISITMVNVLKYTVSDLFNIGYSHTMITSGEIRNENFKHAFSMLSFSNIFGYGINTFRMDSPFLQLDLDLGNLLGLSFIYVGLLYPLVLIKKIQYKRILSSQKLIVLIYLFNLSNLFFHGTPYIYNSWIPILLLYKMIWHQKNSDFIHAG